MPYVWHACLKSISNIPALPYVSSESAEKVSVTRRTCQKCHFAGTISVPFSGVKKSYVFADTFDSAALTIACAKMVPPVSSEMALKVPFRYQSEMLVFAG